MREKEDGEEQKKTSSFHLSSSESLLLLQTWMCSFLDRSLHHNRQKHQMREYFVTSRSIEAERGNARPL